VERGADRVLGLNYIIIQSYPAQEKQLGDEAIALLASHRIQATLEQGLRGFGNLYVVVGTDGFDAPSSPECVRYIQRIRTISDQTYGTGRRFKAFNPLAYKWDRTSR
jgi:hypothetical protein